MGLCTYTMILSMRIMCIFYDIIYEDYVHILWHYLWGLCTYTMVLSMRIMYIYNGIIYEDYVHIQWHYLWGLCAYSITLSMRIMYIFYSIIYEDYVHILWHYLWGLCAYSMTLYMRIMYIYYSIIYEDYVHILWHYIWISAYSMVLSMRIMYIFYDIINELVHILWHYLWGWCKSNMTSYRQISVTSSIILINIYTCGIFYNTYAVSSPEKYIKNNITLDQWLISTDMCMISNTLCFGRLQYICWWYSASKSDWEGKLVVLCYICIIVCVTRPRRVHCLFYTSLYHKRNVHITWMLLRFIYEYKVNEMFWLLYFCICFSLPLNYIWVTIDNHQHVVFLCTYEYATSIQ